MPEEPLAVCYNGDCPVCRSEIGHYRRQGEGAGGEAAIEWIDLAAAPDRLAAHGVDAAQAKRRLHALTADGRLISGVDVFAAIWERLPRYRWLARAVRQPWLRPVAVAFYEGVAVPLLAAFNRYRERRGRR
jgi:predicted DCC family thiol-disulfide oxidoreductase YuxK